MNRFSLIALLALLLAAACAEDDRNRLAVESVIEEEVAKRVEAYKNGRMSRCYSEAVEEASTIADSILLLQARLSRDSLPKPPRPSKPERPELKTLKDSLRVAPIIRRDSLAGQTDSLDN